MKHIFSWSNVVALAVLCALMIPQTAFALTETLRAGAIESADSSVAAEDGASETKIGATYNLQIEINAGIQAAVEKTEREAAIQREKTDKVLSFDPGLIAQIGTQEQTGHSICCPSFSCAYADAVLDGTLNDHSYYSCSCCTWTDWGGGGSSDRYVGNDEELLYEAYTQILAGKPTVIHVSAGYGEHWIALIGYSNAADPAHLSLANFTAIDPWDGAVICAADRFALYGDGCEHISER